MFITIGRTTTLLNAPFPLNRSEWKKARYFAVFSVLKELYELEKGKFQKMAFKLTVMSKCCDKCDDIIENTNVTHDRIEVKEEFI